MEQARWVTVRNEERYVVRDATAGRFTVAETTLQPGRSTRGHTHEGDEVYVFLAGRGRMQAGERTVSVAAGSVVYVAPNEYHRVEAERGDFPFRFLSFFEGERSEG